MKETIEFILTQYADETLIISTCLMGIILFLLAIYWVYNKRKYQQLQHQLPATVVKNYLDSIIQNSTALKSSLFRGGGLDVAPGGTPIVVSNPSSGDGISKEELNQKVAQITALERELADKSTTITDLETRLAAQPAAEVDDQSELIASLRKEIEDLKAQLEANKNAVPVAEGGDAEIQEKLKAMANERDELKERLQEYEIIEDDLANLKRLQQENEQLKKALEAAGGSAPENEAGPAPVAEVPVAEEEPEPEVAPEEPEAEVAPEEPEAEAVPDEPEAAPEAEAAAPAEEEEKKEEDTPTINAEGKSAEDLLSEFEKMLG